MGGFRRRWPLTGSALSGTLARWTQPGFVKSVQRGTITITGATSNTATITAVDVSNSRLRLIGWNNSANGNDNSALPLVTLTNGTTVTASVNTSPGGAITSASFEITEYYPGVIKSIQRGTIAITVTSNTATITTVTTSKAEVDFLGQTSATGTPNTSAPAIVVLTNATTVTATIGAGVGNQTVGYQVIEWF